MLQSLETIRSALRTATLAPEDLLLDRLSDLAALSSEDRDRIAARAAALVSVIRTSDDPGLMEVFLAEYGLSTEEGIALMCLAEALLRVPDPETIDALIEDKIAPSDWGKHLGQSSSSLVNASTWALMLTGKVLDDETPGIAGALRGAVKRLGEPVIRTAVGRAMKEMGNQFVLGEDIVAAMKRANAEESQGYTYSYDMLGEAARTEPDASRYTRAYADAIRAIAPAAVHDEIARNPGISVKLSALHPRYEALQKTRVMAEVAPRLLSLAQAAMAAGIGLNVDAEEADRLDISLDVIAKVLSDESLAGWDGFGVVVQAYGKRAGHVIDWLAALADGLDRRIMVRLVKGAYWDTEIKRAQVLGLADFPVFTRKSATDVSYIACARKLLNLTDRIYPQFATHNAHTVAAILDMADQAGVGAGGFEFQRLHGMGERLHEIVRREAGTRCRIYAPVGAHRDLLAYLVRRLLENGANSSFVNQIVDEDIPPTEVGRDPFAELAAAPPAPGPVALPADIFGPQRRNSKGWDITDPVDLSWIEAARAPHQQTQFSAGNQSDDQPPIEMRNPADPDDLVGHVTEATAADVDAALDAAAPWDASPVDRAAILNRAADLYEEQAGLFFALAAREAGKTLLDAVGELREAVDFLRYYANRIADLDAPPRGVFACISPWNFPLAIFTGQISAALAAGNAVLAKPAEQTPLIAAQAVALLHQAGVPDTALTLLPGRGEVVGAALTSDPRISGICFTGGTDTAQIIHRSMAAHLAPSAPLIAETGGLNAMIVDSTALPEQAVRDILASAFQSAGQRCSALRCLYIQEDVADTVLEMLLGAMAELRLGQPWDPATDVGPVIDAEAKSGIEAHIAQARAEGRLIRQFGSPDTGIFVGPAVIEVDGIGDLEREIFGPVLHVARFASADLDAVIDDINATGYGLTFGLHTRIDDRVQAVVDRVKAGNLYVNRNQIGAIVGSQPFGGEGLSGTGPKAGGPDYVRRFTGQSLNSVSVEDTGSVDLTALQAAIDTVSASVGGRQVQDLPGPTGESNRLSHFGKGAVLCLGPGTETRAAQAEAVRAAGAHPVVVEGRLPAVALRDLAGLDAVCWWGDETRGRAYRQALAARPGAILPLLTGPGEAAMLRGERHICVDTTASGGNAALLAASS